MRADAIEIADGLRHRAEGMVEIDRKLGSTGGEVSITLRASHAIALADFVATHATEIARLEARVAELRHALLDVSVHSAHYSDAPRGLLVALLAKCGEIARATLAPTGETDG